MTIIVTCTIISESTSLYQTSIYSHVYQEFHYELVFRTVPIASNLKLGQNSELGVTEMKRNIKIVQFFFVNTILDAILQLSYIFLLRFL